MVKVSTMLPVVAGFIGAANAHTRVWSLWVNGVDQGDGRGVYIRSPPNNSPVKDVSSTDINCNTNNVAVDSTVSAAAGDVITFEWYHDTRGDDIVDLSHLGPVTVYIAPYSSGGTGDVWTKLAEAGLSGGTWAVETLVANGGKHDVTLPSSLAAGEYLLRSEIIALHEGDTDYTVNSARGAQFYPSCAQVTVTSGGSTTPPGTFNFVGGYSPRDPGILYNLYAGYSTYDIPGPTVWDGSAGGAASTSAAATSAAAVTTAVPVVDEATSSVASAVQTTTTAVVTKATTSTKVATSANAATSTKAATTTAVVNASSAAAANPAASSNPSGTVAKYYQCGGKMWTGATSCDSGLTCVVQNEYYYQCL